MGGRGWLRGGSRRRSGGGTTRPGFGVFLEEAAHERGGGEIGFGGEVGDDEGREAAPEVEGVGEALEPDFFGEEDLGFEGGLAEAGVAPADELVVFDDVVEAGGVEE